MTIAAAANRLGGRYHINDLNKPLMALWRAIIETPEAIVAQYELLWHQQMADSRHFYDDVRAEFNQTGQPHLFLYLLARCVKGSVRYNAQGEFNQSPDNRRLGMKPDTMRMQILGVSYYLKGKTSIDATDYREILALSTPDDLVYMDPPYQGVCGNRDSRYLQNVQYDEFAQALDDLNRRNIRYLVSYDGRTGDKTHGERLPDELDLTLIELYAGRSTQATLLGRDDITIESLYLSPRLADELAHGHPADWRRNIGVRTVEAANSGVAERHSSLYQGDCREARITLQAAAANTIFGDNDDTRRISRKYTRRNVQNVQSSLWQCHQRLLVLR
jgi:DNA adenine methylase